MVSLELNAGDGQSIVGAAAARFSGQPRDGRPGVVRIYGSNELPHFRFRSGSELVGVDGGRAIALKLATEREQMIVHQTADHVEPQQNAVRPMTDRPHESAKVEIS